MLAVTREQFWKWAGPLVEDEGPEAREFAEALTLAIGEISVPDAVTALLKWLDDHKEA